MPNPLLVSVIETVRQPLTFQKSVTILAQKEWFSTPKKKSNELVGIIRKSSFNCSSQFLHARRERVNYLSSLSSSPNASRYTDPHRQALFPRMTIIVELFTAKKMAVPAPQSTEC